LALDVALSGRIILHKYQRRGRPEQSRSMGFPAPVDETVPSALAAR
jgi:hypothetical protein